MKKTQAMIAIIIIFVSTFFYLIVGNTSSDQNNEYESIGFQNIQGETDINKITDLLAPLHIFYSIRYNPSNVLLQNSTEISVISYENVLEMCQLEIRCEYVNSNMEASNAVVVGILYYNRLSDAEKDNNVTYLFGGNPVPIKAIIGSKNKKSPFDDFLYFKPANEAEKQSSGFLEIMYLKQDKAIIDSLFEENNFQIIENKSPDSTNTISAQTKQFGQNFGTWFLSISSIFLCLIINMIQQQRRLTAIKIFVGATKGRLFYEFLQKNVLLAICAVSVSILIHQIILYFELFGFYYISFWYYLIVLFINVMLLSLISLAAILSSKFVDMSLLLKG